MRRLLIASLLLLVGCSAVSKRAKSPTVTVIPSAALGSQPTISMTGDAQVPANVVTGNSVTKIPLPANTKVVFDAALGTYTLLFSLPTTMESDTKSTTVTGATAFTPPAPPTPSDIAAGRMIMVYRIGVLLGGAAALFGLVRGWNLVMWGGLIVLGACLGGLFIQNNPILSITLIAVGVTVSLAGPYIWNRYAKHLNPTP